MSDKLGSSLGTGLAGSILDARALSGNKSLERSTVMLLAITLAGLVIAWVLPRQQAAGPEAQPKRPVG
jgi:hypothetical protein